MNTTRNNSLPKEMFYKGFRNYPIRQKPLMCSSKTLISVPRPCDSYYPIRFPLDIMDVPVRGQRTWNVSPAWLGTRPPHKPSGSPTNQLTQIVIGQWYAKEPLLGPFLQASATKNKWKGCSGPWCLHAAEKQG